MLLKNSENNGGRGGGRGKTGQGGGVIGDGVMWIGGRGGGCIIGPLMAIQCIEKQLHRVVSSKPIRQRSRGLLPYLPLPYTPESLVDVYVEV